MCAFISYIYSKTIVIDISILFMNSRVFLEEYNFFVLFMNVLMYHIKYCTEKNHIKSKDKWFLRDTTFFLKGFT